jgi:hypothetical protein
VVKTNQERFYEDLARQAVTDSFAVSATIEPGSTVCRIEIQLHKNDEDTINLRLELPMTKDSALEEIKKQLNSPS